MIALIPARGGSEGVPRKNLQMVGAFTLLERAIRSASLSEVVNHTFVSSDDDEVLDVGRKNNVSLVRRTAVASSSEATAEMVVDDFLASPEGAQLKQEDYLVYLQPTSPFRTAQHVCEALSRLQASDNSSIVSVKKVSEYPAKTVRVSSSQIISPGNDWAGGSTNRQLIEASYCPNGAIYAFSIAAYRAAGGFPIVGALAYEIGTISSIDIDTPEDLEIARGVATYASI